MKKVKKDKSDADTPATATPEELASQKVQNAPLGLADQTAAQKKAKQKAEKTRIADRPKAPDETPAPYLGQPQPSSTQPAPSTNQPAPAATPPGAPQP